MNAAAPRILLINPNSNAATTAMMVGLAQAEAGKALAISGATATRAPAMITDAAALAAAAPEVVALALSQADSHAGLIVAAFGDPGLAEIRRRSAVPVVGIAESAMHEAAAGGRRFGIATTTPDLAQAIDRRVAELGFGSAYTGLRLTAGDPHALMADPAALVAALRDAVQASIEKDGAEAVIIGGGPLGQAAVELQPLFAVPICAPIAASVRRIAARLA